jgi:hypothetical protein
MNYKTQVTEFSRKFGKLKTLLEEFSPCTENAAMEASPC